MDQNKRQTQLEEQNINYNGMQDEQMKSSNSSTSVRRKPYVRITEQPAGKALRFRYECEGRSAGSIPGVNSTAEKKTYPTIEIVGYKGRAVVVVSCVTKDQPYRPHPHNIVGKEGCKKGVCTLEVNSETMTAVFSNLGIQCVKKKDIESALKAREDLRVDPFKTGFAHRLQPSSIDLNSVRLCFQVFIEKEQKGRFTERLMPVVSDPIFDKKAMSELVIRQLSSSSSTVLGNAFIILLCEKVAKDDISVRFYEEQDGQVIWEAYGEFLDTNVHKQVAISFTTPRYRQIDITEPAKVFVQLKRPSDGVTSDALPFHYVPLDSDPKVRKRKRQKTNDSMDLFGQPHPNQLQNDHRDGRQTNINFWNVPNITAIKTEPRDISPQSFSAYRAPPELTPSPQPLSPASIYSLNTASPYSLATSMGTAVQGNQQMISSNHQYNVPSPNINNNINTNVSPAVVDIRDYNTFGQQPQQHQQYNNNFNVGVTHWQSKYNPTSAGENNLDNTNRFTIANTPAPSNAQGELGTAQNGAVGGWNVIANPYHPQYHMPEQQQQNQQHHQTTTNCSMVTSNNAPNCDNANNVNNGEHSLSTLLTIDSGQLVRINSEDQQMLRLTSEDLQLSNLSIST